MIYYTKDKYLNVNKKCISFTDALQVIGRIKVYKLNHNHTILLSQRYLKF